MTPPTQASEPLLVLQLSSQAQLKHLLIALWQLLALMAVLVALIPYNCALSGQPCAYVAQEAWMAWLPFWSGNHQNHFSLLWHAALVGLAIVCLKNAVINLAHGVLKTQIIVQKDHLHWHVPALNLNTKSIAFKSIAYLDVHGNQQEDVLFSSPHSIVLRTPLNPLPVLSYHASDFEANQSNLQHFHTFVAAHFPAVVLRFFHHFH